MRRAQSVRTYPRTSLTLGSSIDHADLSTLRETSEPPSVEDTLRKQLLDKDRENDKVSPRLRPHSSLVTRRRRARPLTRRHAQLQSTILTLQTQLAARPPLETILSLEKEYKNLDLILQGTQRENERCMAELERVRTRERLLEQALAKVAGENWQVGLLAFVTCDRVETRADGVGYCTVVGDGHRSCHGDVALESHSGNAAPAF